MRHQRMQASRIPRPTSLPALPLLQSEAIPQKDDPLFGAALEQLSGAQSLGAHSGQNCDPLPENGKIAIQPDVQSGGRKAAIALLTSFLQDRSQFYIKNLASPSQGPDTSMRLSPHLACGTISSREVEASIRNYLGNPESNITPAKRRGCRAVMSRLAWRCHFMQKLEDQPDIEWAAMHPLYESVRDDMDQDAGRKAMEHGVKTLEVNVRGPGSGRESALRALQAAGFTITSIRDVTPIPHNGCRPPKRRRV